MPYTTCVTAISVLKFANFRHDGNGVGLSKV